MKAVLTTPDASPESSGFTSLIAPNNSGLNAMPAPMPSSVMPGNTSIQNVPSSGARANSASPAAAHSSPNASGLRQPNFMTIFADSPSENAAMMRFAGRNESPTSIAL